MTSILKSEVLCECADHATGVTLDNGHSDLMPLPDVAGKGLHGATHHKAKNYTLEVGHTGASYWGTIYTCHLRLMSVVSATSCSAMLPWRCEESAAVRLLPYHF